MSIHAEWAERHAAMAQRHATSARRHDASAKWYEERGEPELAEFARRRAWLAREGAKLEIDQAAFERRRQAA